MPHDTRRDHAGSPLPAEPATITMTAATALTPPTTPTMHATPTPLDPGQYSLLARRSGVSRAQVSRILRGLTRNPGIATVVAIADAARLSVEEVQTHAARQRDGRQKLARAERKRSRSATAATAATAVLPTTPTTQGSRG